MVYYDRVKEALAQDANQKDYTKNEHLYLTVLSALLCNRIHYAINVLESILMNDPVDILCINTLHMLYKMLGEGNRMFASLSRVWSYWGISIPCDELMNGYRADCLSEMGRNDEAERVGMQTLSGDAQDVRAVHAVVHVLETQGRTREGLRFLRETAVAWSNHPVDYVSGSTMDHHLLSHKITLNMQVKQYENAIVILDGMLLREMESVNESVNESAKESAKDGQTGEKDGKTATKEGTTNGKTTTRGKSAKAPSKRDREPTAATEEQDMLTNDHINDYVQVLYRMELLGEGMGDRWSQVLSLAERTHKKYLTPMDKVYRSILYSVTGQEKRMRELLSGDATEQQNALWKELQLPETQLKWEHVNGDDRMNSVAEAKIVQPVVESLLELNNEHYAKAGKLLFQHYNSFPLLGGERRDHELLMLSMYKALDGCGMHRVLERVLNDFTSQNAKRADAFILLSDCVKKMGFVRKAETLNDFAHNLGYEQGGNETNLHVCFSHAKSLPRNRFEHAELQRRCNRGESPNH